MRTISYDGVASATTDEVATALIELAIVVAQYRRYESVTFPVLKAGRIEELTLMLGPTIHLSSCTSSASPDVDIPGAEEVAAELRHRAKVFADPVHVLETDLRV